MEKIFLDSKLKRRQLETTPFSFPRKHVNSQIIKEMNLYRIMVVYAVNEENSSGFKMMVKTIGNYFNILFKDNKEKEDVGCHVSLRA